MPSEILVTSKSNLNLVKHIPYLSGCEIILVDSPPNTIPNLHKGKVYALGGGSVIDTAKMLAGRRGCYAIPTNACGSATTSHAVIWNKGKINVNCRLPILMDDYRRLPIKLSNKNIERTSFDCGCHIIESRYSVNANWKSIKYCTLAEEQLLKFAVTGNIINLIEAGNIGGMAIEITGTNYFHAISYVLTLDYGLCHGDALKQALKINTHKDYKEIIKKAQTYSKFFDSTLL